MSSMLKTLFGRRIGSGALIAWLKRMGHALKAGVEVRKALSSESERGTTSQRERMKYLLGVVSDGDPLSVGMREMEGYFPELCSEMVEIGEHTGHTDETFLKLAEYYDHSSKIFRNFLVGILWPSIQLVAGVGIVGLLIWAFGVIAGSTGGTPFDVTGLGLSGASGAMTFFFLVFGTIGALVGTAYAISRGVLGPAAIYYSMKIPLLGDAFRYLALGRLTWAFSMALDAGVDAKRSVRMALKASQNPLYSGKIDDVVASITRGKEFHESFRSAGDFPDEFLDSLEAAELSGTLTTALINLNQEYERKANESLQLLGQFAQYGVYGSVSMLLIYMIYRLASFYLGAIYGALDSV